MTSPKACASASLAEGHPILNDAGEGSIQFDDVYLHRSPMLIRQLSRKIGCRETARDLAQEAFLRLLGMSADARTRVARPDSYVRRISANLMTDWCRSLALRERACSHLEQSGETVVDQVAILESRDMLRRVEQAIGKLRPKTREIFLAHRVEGLSYGEIAVRTGLSIKGVEKQMSKAIAKIDRLLDRD